MKNLSISMLKWGKSALRGPSWKHKHSFSASELEYKFDRNAYKKMDNNLDIESSYIENSKDNFIPKPKNINNIKEKEKWLVTSLSNNDSFSSSFSNSNISVQSEQIKEKDAAVWKRYVQYEIKDMDYLNLNITNLLKEYINKNKNVNKMSDILPNDIYKNKTIIQKIDNNSSYDKVIDLNKKINLSSSNNNYYKAVDSPQNDFNNNTNNGMYYNNSILNHPINQNKKSLSITDYNIQTIEYNLKYNSNYDVENIPEEIIIELLNNQLQYKENNDSIIPNLNKSPRSTPISTISSPLEKAASLKNFKTNYSDSDIILKEDNSSFLSELTANVSQTISTEKSENNWNSLYVINEIPDLSAYSNSPEYYSNNNTSNNLFDDSNCTSSEEYYQFYLDNRPQSIHKKQKKKFKNVIKVSYKHLCNTVRVKQRRASTSTIETGNTTFYSMDENENNTGYTDIISFNDALNLPIEKNSK
ncbi:hypothetical protein BCR36DRAFT_580515 [Piromyces finnis]|uniref:Uncharacterized protein n=1 Tax=Piromyces finnis TaxID=1754191 RepID=A0A1Y1VI60_9FUNG|nr:hypothetical protein BCR36DRAFT_580515 [Piromyces finnis]|eukprot:ORX57096.1 hypothetical protein BCR36DRAFT_580515 [Piromyces finnis]